MTTTDNVTITKIIEAPRGALFEAWLEPEALRRFMCPGPGVTVSRAEAEPRVGGQFLVVMLAGDAELPHRGEYLAIERYGRLSFTWLSEHAGPGSEVTITFEALGPATTQLTLRHVGLATAAARDRHRGGWTHIVDRLAAATGDC